MSRYPLLVLSFLWVVHTTAFSQIISEHKPLIDSSAYLNWSVAASLGVSANGSYVAYRVWSNGIANTTIQSMKNDWQVRIRNVDEFNFTSNSKTLIYKRSDSLYSLTLGTTDLKKLGAVTNYKLAARLDKNDWLIYFSDNDSNKLHLRNVNTGKEQLFDRIKKYWTTKDGTSLFMLNAIGNTLSQVELSNCQVSKTFRCDNVKEFADAAKSDLLAYEDSTGIFVILNGQVEKINTPDGWHFDSFVGFNQTGDRLFIRFYDKENTGHLQHTLANVDIWSYLDYKLQSQQLVELKKPERSLIWVYQLRSKHLIQLEKYNEELRLDDPSKLLCKYRLLEKHNFGWNNMEDRWNSLSSASEYLVNTDDGSRRLLNNCITRWKGDWIYDLSPEEKYVIYYNPQTWNYYTLKTTSGEKHVITNDLKGNWSSFDFKENLSGNNDAAAWPLGWIKGDKGVLLAGQHDLFMVDPTGKNKAVNITRGVGKSHNYSFSLAFDHSRIFDPKKHIIVEAFDRKTKNNGFYKVDLSGNTAPEILTMEPVKFVGVDDWEKAADADAYIVMKSTASDGSNVFYTGDLKKFVPLTDVHPERAYNWLTSELITWKAYDGTVSQGILYKPENFDQHKKYPMVVEYYQKNSEKLHDFLTPGWSVATIDIPTYVSNGYLVFVPDIHYKTGYTAKSVINCVESGTKYLSTKYPWVDSNHIGISGHSFGGAETEMIITHSHFFAAACAASGWSDEISISNSLNSANGYSNRWMKAEGNHMNLGYSLWRHPDFYIENSSIFYADKVTTPLLMMNNKADEDVEFSEGIQFFTALRSLGKRVWMLQYDHEGHQLGFNSAAAKDFSIRMMQFFDHYLKGKPAPIWMTRGIPASQKGITTGYEYDTQIATPGAGLTKTDNTHRSSNTQLLIKLIKK